MLDACERTVAIVANLERRHFDDWSLERLAVERLLLVIGEAAKGIPPAVRTELPAINWRNAGGLRDRIVHQYADTDPDILWSTVTVDVPAMVPHLRALLTKLQAGAPDG